MRFRVSIVGRVLSEGHADNEIEAWIDDTMDELLHLGADDVTIDLDLSAVTVALAANVDSANPIGAISQASGLFRTAIHTAGGATPDWPDPHDGHVWGIQLVDVAASELSGQGDLDDERDGDLVEA